MHDLTVDEFVRAFSMYKQVICEAYSTRREELDKYMAFVVSLAGAGGFPGFTFYEYHLLFSAKVVKHFKLGVKVNWGERCPQIFSTVIAGKKANVCVLCQSYDHSTGFCALAADKPYRPQQSHDRNEICKH